MPERRNESSAAHQKGRELMPPYALITTAHADLLGEYATRGEAEEAADRLRGLGESVRIIDGGGPTPSAATECHICHRMQDEPGEVWCSYPHPLGETRSAAISHEEALAALNMLRSNVVGAQSASWSNLVYPLVAILNAAGFEQIDPTEKQLRQHMDCYGGAGGYPGHELREPDPGWCAPVGRLKNLSQAVRHYLADPTDENRGYLAANLRDEG